MNRFLIQEMDLNYSFKRYSLTTCFVLDAVLGIGNIDVKKTESCPEQASVFLAGETDSDEKKKKKIQFNIR